MPGQIPADYCATAPRTPARSGFGSKAEPSCAWEDFQPALAFPFERATVSPMSLAICLSATPRNDLAAAAAKAFVAMWTRMKHFHGCAMMMPMKAGPRRVR